MDWLTISFSWLQAVFQENFWIIKIFIIVLLTLSAHSAEAIIYRRLYQRLMKTKNYWDDSLLGALHRPLGVLIWTLGISFAADVAAGAAPKNTLGAYIEPLRELIVLVVIVWFLIRFIQRIEESLLEPKPGKRAVDATAVHAISQLLSATVVITSGLVGMQMFGFPISGLLAFGGVGALTVGLAAKDLLGNFFGGLMIYLDRPFKVGDWIRSPDKEIEGTVEHIGWRLTRIRTFDKRPLYVPNGMFSNIPLENPSRMSNRRIKTTVGIRYDDADKLRSLLPAIENMLREHPEIDTRQTLMVNLIEFAPSSLDFMIYTFTKTTQWVKFQSIQQDIFLRVLDIIAEHGAECAFPTRTLHVPEHVQFRQTKDSS